MSDRLRIIEAPRSRATLGFSQAVCEGLRSQPRSLPSRFFYDHRGSELFERITRLPEYYPTRCEASIFSTYASEIVHSAGEELSLVEFGSGSSAKTRLLLTAILAKQATLDYAPIDISAEFLKESSLKLLNDFAGLRIAAISGEYFDGIGAMPDFDRPRLILFLGSNIGNFEDAEAIEFLARIRSVMRASDRLLVGTDLVKDPAIIEAAYNDSLGVTAAFNKNLLGRINAELDGRFDLNLFQHEAPYLIEEQRIEMRLVSTCDQIVCIEKLDLPVAFTEGEAIHTEYSQKYTEFSFAEVARRSGLEITDRWLDEQGWFALNLLRGVSA